MSDPVDLIAYRARTVPLAARSLTAYSPEWHQDAACAGDTEPRSWSYTESFFEDEVDAFTPAQIPEPLQNTMEVCWGCPVRRECLAEAYAQEKHIDDKNKLKPRIVEDSTRFGVWGGIPGRVRSKLAREPDRLDAAELWLSKVAEALRWGYADVVESLWESKGRTDGEAETA